MTVYGILGGSAGIGASSFYSSTLAGNYGFGLDDLKSSKIAKAPPASNKQYGPFINANLASYEIDSIMFYMQFYFCLIKHMLDIDPSSWDKELRDLRECYESSFQRLKSMGRDPYVFWRYNCSVNKEYANKHDVIRRDLRYPKEYKEELARWLRAHGLFSDFKGFFGLN